MKFEDVSQEPRERPLTDRQRIFVAEYLKDRNATQAAIRAGYSAKTANEQGARLLANVSIRRAVNESTKRQIERLEWDAKRTLLEITRMANVDPKIYEGVTCPADVARLPEDARRAIVGWGWDRNGNFTLKFAKERSLEMLGRHFKLFTDVVEIKDETGLAARMDKARKRVKGGNGG